MVPVNIYEEILWPQFRNLPQIAKLPINEQVRAYNTYSWDLTTQRMVHQSQLAAQGNGGGFESVGIPDPIPSNCIEFVANTTDGTFFEFTISSNVQDFSYTVEWGDGESGEGSSGEGSISLQHVYPDGGAEYTVRVCFSDPSVINNINFPGFD